MILITGGCSFSETKTLCAKTWPHWLARQTKFHTISTAMGSQGNGMISRQVIHSVHEQLKHTSADNILVGIMWSGPSRHEQYSSEKIDFNGNIDGWMENPTSYADQDPGGWIIYNNYWKIKQAQHFYRYMYDPVYSQVLTLEHIIRVQNYLKLHNIKYFMSTYTKEVLMLRDNPNLDHLYEQIDFDCFLPCVGELEWCIENTSLELGPDGEHPSDYQHQQFTNEVIIPWIKQKYKIDINC
mgnify:FL=1|jgi:hypothetical protein